MRNLPSFPKFQTVRADGVCYYLHSMSAYCGYPAETVTSEEAHAMVADEAITAPHFYSIVRDGHTEYYVPDCNGEHCCHSESAAREKLRDVMADLYGPHATVAGRRV